jgi:O-methyltransferase
MSLVETVLNSQVLPNGSGTICTKLVHLLGQLEIVLSSGIEGEVVELGCHFGGSSIFIRAMLDAFGSTKQFHVYDSWLGVPKPTDPDLNTDQPFSEGACATYQGSLVENFEVRNLEVPVIHSGWFSEIPDDEYPSKIAFAFLDGDMYTSTYEGLSKIYSKVSLGGRIVLDDYGWGRTPGVRLACSYFLQGKEEVVQILEDYYPHSNEPGFSGGGLLIKGSR